MTDEELTPAYSQMEETMKRLRTIIALAALTLVLGALPARADFLYNVDALIVGNPSTINANQTNTINTISENFSGVTKTIKTRLWLTQGWFMNGVPAPIGGGTTCASLVGSRLWECTTSVPDSSDVEINWPVVSRPCLPATAELHAEVWVDGVMHDQQIITKPGGTGRFACAFTWLGYTNALLNNHSYYYNFTFSAAYSAAHAGRLQFQIAQSSALAQFDVVGGADQVQWFIDPGNVPQDYCPAFATHTYAKCEGTNPGANVWQSGKTGRFDVWFHTFTTDGQLQTYARFYDLPSGSLYFEQYYFENET